MPLLIKDLVQSPTIDSSLLCKTSINELTRAFIDQFQRAALSIPLNLTEGNGRGHAYELILFNFCSAKRRLQRRSFKKSELAQDGVRGGRPCLSTLKLS
jgi:hypothetical protein